jgi:hypothetical protein
LIDDFAIIAFILLYNFDLIEIRVSSNHIMISFLYHRDHIARSISLSSIDSINFREDHVIFVIFELSYYRIVNDSLNLIQRTRQVALWHRVEWGRLFPQGWMGTTFSTGLNGDGFSKRVEWGRLFRLGRMGTTFSKRLNEDGFFIWVKWERLFRLGWMGTTFSKGLNEDGFFKRVEWRRLFHMSWMRTAFLAGLNEDGFFKRVEWERLFQMSWMRTAFS